MRTLIQDVRYAVRSLFRRLSFTAVAVLALALGIGANTAIFSFVHGVLLKRLPYANTDRIHMIYATNVQRNLDGLPLYVGDYLDLRNLRSEEHTSELQSHSFISYAV